MTKFCDGLLETAARRWPAELRAEMLAEWRAELRSEDSFWRRVRYAASLVLTHPARESKMSFVLAGAGLIGSVLAILVLPAFYVSVSIRWLTVYSEDTIAGQVAIGAAGLAGSVLLALICARVTSGATQLIRPHVVPLWTFGVAYTGGMAYMLATSPMLIKADVIDLSCWALAATVLGTVSVWLRLAGRRVTAWLAAISTVLVAFWFVNMHGSVSHLDDMGMRYFFHGSWAAGYSFVVLTSPWLHVTIFLTGYAISLAARGGRTAVEVPAAAVTE